jgi:large subunit ribosomal protein L15
MILLNDLYEKPGSRKAYKRVGRGNHHTKGGGKGQTKRSGVALGNFQGGQTPIERRLPKQISFYTRPKMATVSLETVCRLVDVNFPGVIDYVFLRTNKAIKKADSFKIVGKCCYALNIVSDAISKGALQSIKGMKGTWKKTEGNL